MIASISQSVGDIVERQVPARAEKAASSQSAAPSTAVVPVAPADIVPGHTVRVHPDTSFLMQLMATISHEPQTRNRRQADPATGVARYAAAVSATAPIRPENQRHSEVV